MKELSVERVWILEDEIEIRTVLASVLRYEGHHVEEFGSLVEARVAFQRALANPAENAPQVVLSDRELVDGNSDEWIFEIRSCFPGAKVVCISGSLDRAFMKQLENLGIAAIEKPLTLGQVLAILRGR